MVRFVRLFTGVLVALASALSLSLAGTATQQQTCADFNVLFAQVAMDLDPSLAESLDPDGNGTACDHEATGGTGQQGPPEPTLSPTLDSTVPSSEEVGHQSGQSVSLDRTTTQASGGPIGSHHAAFEAIHGDPIDQMSADAVQEGSEGYFYAYAPPPTAELLSIRVIGDVVNEISLYPEAVAWTIDESMGMLQPFLPPDITELPPLEQVDEATYVMSLHSTQMATPDVEQYMLARNLSGLPGDFWVALETTESGEHVYEIHIGLGTRAGTARAAQLQDPAGQTATQASSGILGNTRAIFDAVHGVPLDQLPPDEAPEATEAFYYAPPITASELLVYYYEGIIDLLYISAETPWTFDESMSVLQPFLPAGITELPPLEQIDDGTYFMSLHSTEFVTDDNVDWLREIYHGEPGDFYVRLYTEDGTHIYEIELGIGNLAVALDNETTQLNDLTLPTTDETSPGITAEADAFLTATREEVDVRLSELESLQAIIAAGTYTEAESVQMADIIVIWMEVNPSLPPAPVEFSDMALQVQDLREEIGYLGTDLARFLTGPQSTDLSEAGYTVERIELALGDLDAQLISLGY